NGGAGLRWGGVRAAPRLRGGSLGTAEVALGLVLTVLAGLTMRTFEKLRSVDLGFDSERVVFARVGVSGARHRTPEARAAFFDQVLSRVKTLPGVQAASAVSTRPFGGMGPATTLGDASAAEAGDSVAAGVRYIDADLFRTAPTPPVA